jgi:hypothetical protein
MTRRLSLVIWFIAIIAVIPLAVAAFFFDRLREPFFWVSAVAAAPFIISIVEYILTGDTKTTKALMGRKT